MIVTKWIEPLILVHHKPVLLTPVFFYVNSGVNTFAMLTGTLPFIVEPFNIKVLLRKMMTKDMTQMPRYVSKGKPSYSTFDWLVLLNNNLILNYVGIFTIKFNSVLEPLLTVTSHMLYSMIQV